MALSYTGFVAEFILTLALQKVWKIVELDIMTAYYCVFHFVLVGMYILALSHIKYALNYFNFFLLTEGMRYHSFSQIFVNWYIVEFSSNFNHWQLEIDLGLLEVVICQIVHLTLFKLSSKGLQHHSDSHCTCHAPTQRLPAISECAFPPFSSMTLFHHLVLSIITQSHFIFFIYQSSCSFC